MFEGLKLFLDLCYVYNIFKTNLVQKYVIGGLKSNVNIELKLELVTTYHKGFVVKLLWKCCEYNITLIFVEPKFL